MTSETIDTKNHLGASGQTRPGRVMQKRMRRVPVEVRVDIERGEETLGGSSINMSPSGICFSSPEPLEEGSDFHIILYMPEGKREFSLLKVEARHIWQKPEGEGYRVGAQFLKFAPGDERRIRSWLMHLMQPKA